MTIRPHRPGDGERSLGESFERTRDLERLSSGIWILVGSGLPLPDGPDLDGNVNAPPFQNGWTNAGGTLQPLRFRWLVGAGIEVQGSVTGGALATVIFTLPNHPLYRFSAELRGSASDDDGIFVPIRVLANGEVIGGL